jgi:hypothetical protein
VGHPLNIAVTQAFDRLTTVGRRSGIQSDEKSIGIWDSGSFYPYPVRQFDDVLRPYAAKPSACRIDFL